MNSDTPKHVNCCDLQDLFRTNWRNSWHKHDKSSRADTILKNLPSNLCSTEVTELCTLRMWLRLKISFEKEWWEENIVENRNKMIKTWNPCLHLQVLSSPLLKPLFALCWAQRNMNQKAKTSNCSAEDRDGMDCPCRHPVFKTSRKTWTLKWRQIMINIDKSVFTWTQGGP